MREDLEPEFAKGPVAIPVDLSSPPPSRELRLEHRHQPGQASRLGGPAALLDGAPGGSLSSARFGQDNRPPSVDGGGTSWACLASGGGLAHNDPLVLAADPAVVFSRIASGEPRCPSLDSPGGAPSPGAHHPLAPSPARVDSALRAGAGRRPRPQQQDQLGNHRSSVSRLSAGYAPLPATRSMALVSRSRSLLIH